MDVHVSPQPSAARAVPAATPGGAADPRPSSAGASPTRPCQPLPRRVQPIHGRGPTSFSDRSGSIASVERASVSSTGMATRSEHRARAPGWPQRAARASTQSTQDAVREAQPGHMERGTTHDSPPGRGTPVAPPATPRLDTCARRSGGRPSAQTHHHATHTSGTRRARPHRRPQYRTSLPSRGGSPPRVVTGRPGWNPWNSPAHP